MSLTPVHGVIYVGIVVWSSSMITTVELIAFERDIADLFNRSEIRSPVHLSGGNEAQLIDYFVRNFNADRGDWVCGSWRMHYHALLAGVPPAEVRAQILAGRSITLTFPAHRVISSAIVGGILPIALGIALGIRRRGSDAQVHCFVGDMTATTGAYAEATRYARGHDLPITFIVEDNGISVLTDTREVWGTSPFLGLEERYFYKNSFPHAGAGVRVDF